MQLMGSYPIYTKMSLQLNSCSINGEMFFSAPSDVIFAYSPLFFFAKEGISKATFTKK